MASARSNESAPVGTGRAVFLDRDGVINEEVEYLDAPERLVLVPGAARAIRRLNEAGVPVVVVTNQAGVGRGYFPEERVADIHGALSALLAAEGARVDRYEHCPHHPTAGLGPYRVACDCRKPAPGMLIRAAEALGLRLGGCFLVGDKRTDLGAARAVGCAAILVRTGYGDEEWASWRADWVPAFVARDLDEAAQWILAEIAPDADSTGR